MSTNQQLGEPAYAGPIFDSDSHVHEHDFDFFKDYLPKKYHDKWLLARKVGPDGRFGLWIGDRKVENAEANAEGLVPPPGKLKEWLRAMKEGKSNVDGLDQAHAGNLRPRCPPREAR